MQRFLEASPKWKAIALSFSLFLLAVFPPVFQTCSHLVAARLALERNRPGEAAANLARAAVLIPWRTRLWEQAGLAAHQGGDAAAAIGYLERAGPPEALSWDGRVALGEAYRRTGNLLAAIQVWQSAVRVGDQEDLPEIYQNLLAAHLSLKDYSAAIGDLKVLIAHLPMDASLRYQLGLLLATQQPETALAHLLQAAEYDPELHPEVDLLAGSIRSAARSDDPAYALVSAGRALAALDEWDLAVEAFQRAGLVRPDYAEAWAFAAEARQHLDGGDSSAQALRDLEKALALDPASLSANLFLALYWQRQDRFDLALDVLHKAVRYHPSDPHLQVELGNTLAALGKLDRAMAAYQRAAGRSPRDPAYLRSLAIFTIHNDYRVRQVGLPAARQAVLTDPYDPASLDVMGQVLFRMGDILSAERFFRRALAADPKYPPAHLHLGLVYMERGEYSLAYQKLDQVRVFAPGSAIDGKAQRLLQNYFP